MAKIDMKAAYSFWAKFETLAEAKYRGEWSVYNIKHYVDNYASIEDITVTMQRFKTSDDSYWSGATANINASISGTEDVFANGTTNINVPHVFYDKANGNLFVYQGSQTGVYYKLYISVCSGYDSLGEGITESKVITLPVLVNPKFVANYKDDEGLHKNVSGNCTIKMNTRDRYYYVGWSFVDPETNEVIRFGGPSAGPLWGAAFDRATNSYYQFTGSTNSIPSGEDKFSTYYFTNEVNLSENESSDKFTDSGCSYTLYSPDPYSGDLCNEFEFKSGTTSLAYDDDCYVDFEHDFYGGGTTFHPVVEYVAPDAPKVNTLHVLNANEGTNEYSEMKPGYSYAPDTFYLMYGFKQTYFISVDNIDFTSFAYEDTKPIVTMSHASDMAPYLQYSLQKINKDYYRLDFWVDRYENPLTYDDTAMPYSSTGTDFDENAGDKSVEITISYPGAANTQTMMCKVLHKRFSLSLVQDSAGDMKMFMWNPLELKLTGRAYINSTQTQYSFDPDEYAIIAHGLVADYSSYNKSLVSPAVKIIPNGTTFTVTSLTSGGIYDIEGKTFPFNAKIDKITKKTSVDFSAIPTNAGYKVGENSCLSLGEGIYLIEEAVVDKFYLDLGLDEFKVVGLPLAIKVPNDINNVNCDLDFDVNLTKTGLSTTLDELNKTISLNYASFSFHDSGKYKTYYCIATNFWASNSHLIMGDLAGDIINAFANSDYENAARYKDFETSHRLTIKRSGITIFTCFPFTGKHAFQSPGNPNRSSLSYRSGSDYMDRIPVEGIQFRTARTQMRSCTLTKNGGNWHTGEARIDF